MNFGDLTDNLLNIGKEKAKELSDEYLSEKQGQEGLVGQGAGIAKSMLDGVFDGGNADNSESESGAGSASLEDGGPQDDSGSDSEENNASDDDDADNDKIDDNH